MLSHFHLIPERNGQTDRETDRRTDRFAISISRVSMLTREKKRKNYYEKFGYGRQKKYSVAYSAHIISDIKTTAWCADVRKL